MATRTITVQTTPFNSGVSGFTDPHIFDVATERENMFNAGYMTADEAALRMGINASVFLSQPPGITPLAGQFGNYFKTTSIAAWASFRGITFNSN
jgi:hypothetical protein